MADEVEALRKRVTELEKLAAVLVEHTPQITAAFVEALRPLDQRIEALEETVKSHQLTIDEVHKAVDKRIGDLGGMDRQDRWHATYNAALASYSLYDLGVEQAHSLCTAYADRAHGPLEPKA